MMRSLRLALCAIGAVGATAVAPVAPLSDTLPAPSSDPLFKSGSDSLLPWLAHQTLELHQELKGLEGFPVHHTAVRLHDSLSILISSERGALLKEQIHRGRALEVDVRLGDSLLDSSHPSLDGGELPPAAMQVELPLEIDSTVFRRLLRQTAEWSYRSAREHFTALQASQGTRTEEQRGQDFAPARLLSADSTGSAPTRPDTLQLRRWRQQVQQLSARLRENRLIHGSQVFLEIQRTRFASSTGAANAWDQQLVHLGVWLHTRTSEGMDLEQYRSWSLGALTDSLPEPELSAAVDSLADLLAQLRDAPQAQPYAGPVLLEGPAAAVFIHEILGHRVESHRLRQQEDGQTLLARRGQRVTNSAISILDDPTRTHWGTTRLDGYYPFDDQGVPSQPVTLLDHGILQGFLNSRSTADLRDSSNGHGRGQLGSGTVSRMGNTLLIAHQPLPMDSLRARLLAEVRRLGLPYGIRVRDLSGGFTHTGRSLPQSFKLTPYAAWRVYPDGRPDELIRGLDASGTPLVSFSQILAAGDHPEVFNGYCGAESGWVPVASVSPSLLLGMLEFEIQQGSSNRPPLLEAPR